MESSIQVPSPIKAQGINFCCVVARKSRYQQWSSGVSMADFKLLKNIIMKQVPLFPPSEKTLKTE